MRKGTVQGLSASGTGPQSATNLIGSTTIRPLLSEYTVGLRTNPNSTDQQVRFALGNTTATGTAASNPTPKPNDPNDVALQTTAGITHSAEPTYGATYFHDSDLNQRGSYRWVAETGFEYAGANSANNGIGLKMIAVTAAIVLSNPMGFKE